MTAGQNSTGADFTARCGAIGAISAMGPSAAAAAVAGTFAAEKPRESSREPGIETRFESLYRDEKRKGPAIPPSVFGSLTIGEKKSEPAPETVSAMPAGAIDMATSVFAQAGAATVSETAEAIASRILVSEPLASGEGEVRIVLKPSLLDGTAVRISIKDGLVSVNFTPATEDAASFIEKNLPQLQANLAKRIPKFRFSVSTGKDDYDETR